MQNYAYNRNVVNYRVTSARRVRSRLSLVRAIVNMLLEILLSDAAILVYKGVAFCAALILLVGVVGGMETGSIPLPLGFSVCSAAAALGICKLFR